MSAHSTWQPSAASRCRHRAGRFRRRPRSRSRLCRPGLDASCATSRICLRHLGYQLAAGQAWASMPCSRIAPNRTRPNPGMSSESLRAYTPEIAQDPCEGVRGRPRSHASGRTDHRRAAVRADAGRRPRRCPGPTSGQRAIELLAAATRLRAEHVSGQALDVDMQRHGHAGTGRADDHRQMLAAAVHVTKADDSRVAGPGGQDRVSVSRTTWGSVRRRYATSSAIETTASPCSTANSTNSTPRAIRVGIAAGDDLAERGGSSAGPPGTPGRWPPRRVPGRRARRRCRPVVGRT